MCHHSAFGGSLFFYHIIFSLRFPFGTDPGNFYCITELYASVWISYFQRFIYSAFFLVRSLTYFFSTTFPLVYAKFQFLLERFTLCVKCQSLCVWCVCTVVTFMCFLFCLQSGHDQIFWWRKWYIMENSILFIA